MMRVFEVCDGQQILMYAEGEIRVAKRRTNFPQVSLESQVHMLATLACSCLSIEQPCGVNALRRAAWSPGHTDQGWGVGFPLGRVMGL